jgi:hypothetical protein
LIYIAGIDDGACADFWAKKYPLLFKEERHVCG